MPATQSGSGTSGRSSSTLPPLDAAEEEPEGHPDDHDDQRRAGGRAGTTAPTAWSERRATTTSAATPMSSSRSSGLVVSDAAAASPSAQIHQATGCRSRDSRVTAEPPAHAPLRTTTCRRPRAEQRHHGEHQRDRHGAGAGRFVTASVDRRGGGRRARRAVRGTAVGRRRVGRGGLVVAGGVVAGRRGLRPLLRGASSSPPASAVGRGRARRRPGSEARSWAIASAAPGPRGPDAGPDRGALRRALRRCGALGGASSSASSGFEEPGGLDGPGSTGSSPWRRRRTPGGGRRYTRRPGRAPLPGESHRPPGRRPSATPRRARSSPRAGRAVGPVEAPVGVRRWRVHAGVGLGHPVDPAHEARLLCT